MYILPVLMVVCLIVMGISLYKVISISMDYRQGEKEYDLLQSYITERKEGPVSDQEAEKEAEEEKGKKATEGTGALAEACPLDVDFAHLQEINPDLVCWLYIPVLDLSYPVVQGTDNEYYLHRTFEGTENFAGTLFVDAEIAQPLKNPHTIIYGHSMKNQTMFGKLKLLLQDDLYKQEPYFWIITPERSIRYQMANIGYTDAGSSVYTLFENADDSYTAYLQEMTANATVEIEQLPELSENCSLVTLSTCAAAEGTARLVVQGIALKD